jgi:hypothetical protein
MGIERYDESGAGAATQVGEAKARATGLSVTSLATVVALALLASGCGKKGDPTPPLRVIPAQTSDLRASQRGDQLVLRFAYPATTTSGARLPGLDAVEVWQMTRPAPDPAAPPTVDPPEFAAASKPLVTLSGAELQSAISGGAVVVRLPVPPPTTPPTLHVFAVKTHATEGETSGWSNLARLVPQTPPAPAAGLAVTPQARGVELSWTATEGAGAGFVVYRRPAESRAYGEPLATLPADARRHLDETARYGERYIYTVTALASSQPPVESAFGAEREVDYQDRFAPAAPEDVVALPGDGGVNLLWKASPDTDTVGYHVYRRDPDAEFRRLTTAPTAELKFNDSGLAGGLLYTYRVTAIDGAGNEGMPAGDVEVRPR